MATIAAMQAPVVNAFDHASDAPPAYHFSVTVPVDSCAPTCGGGARVATKSLFVDAAFAGPSGYGPTGGTAGAASGAWVYWRQGAPSGRISATPAFRVMAVTRQPAATVPTGHALWLAGATGNGAVGAGVAMGRTLDEDDRSTLTFGGATGGYVTEASFMLRPTTTGNTSLTTAVPNAVQSFPSARVLRAFPVPPQAYDADSPATAPPITDATRFTLAWLDPDDVAANTRTLPDGVTKFGFDNTAGLPVLNAKFYVTNPCASWCSSTLAAT